MGDNISENNFLKNFNSNCIFTQTINSSGLQIKNIKKRIRNDDHNFLINKFNKTNDSSSSDSSSSTSTSSSSIISSSSSSSPSVNKNSKRNRKNRSTSDSNKTNKTSENNNTQKPKIILRLPNPANNSINRTPTKETIVPLTNNWSYLDYETEYINNFLSEIKCSNNLCDHTTHEELWYDNNSIPITKVNTIEDLISLGSYYHCKMRVEYNGIDMKILHELKTPLQELNNMIGLKKIKEEIVNTVIYFLLTKNMSGQINTDMLHSVITGSAGCGKTTFIEILAKIYTSLGILKKGHIVKTNRSQLIGKFLGHTAVQTKQKITEAYDGILLIDEAYSLGNPEGRDSFAKECLDTLNQALSEEKTKFVCIIAGYSNALEDSFFKYNEGLKRRFPFKYDIEKYSPDELSMILYKKIQEYGHYGVNTNSFWTLEFSKEELKKLIKEYYKYFIHQGGDMETIFLGTKIAQNKRVFLLKVEEKKKLLLSDIKTSVVNFISMHGRKEEKDDYMVKAMYI